MDPRRAWSASSRRTRYSGERQSKPSRPDDAAGRRAESPSVSPDGCAPQVDLAHGEAKVHAIEGPVTLARAHGLGANERAFFRIDDDEVRVIARRDRPFALLQAGQSRRRFGDPPSCQPDIPNSAGQLEAAHV